MRRVTLIIFALVLVLGLAGCGEKVDKESYGGVSYVPPGSWAKQESDVHMQFYDDSEEYFVAMLLITETKSDEFLYGETVEEEVAGYIDFLSYEEPTYQWDMIKSDAKVDGYDGTAITYSLDYSRSEYPDEQEWGITYFTEVIIPVDDTVYYFTLEESNRGDNKELYDQFMKSVEFN